MPAEVWFAMTDPTMDVSSIDGRPLGETSAPEREHGSLVHAPHDGVGEIGLGLQVAIVGADVGVDPWEIVEFLAGLITMDPVEDDL